MINIVLHEPEIPFNTGAIGRTCVATDSRLHMIGPDGFVLNDKYLKRAGMDYRDLVNVTVHQDWEEFAGRNPGTWYFTTRYGHQPPDAFDFTVDEEIYFIFGKESTGIPKDLLKEHLSTCIRIPMNPDARCLNVSNTAAIVLYEAMRQRKYVSLSFEETLKPGILK